MLQQRCLMHGLLRAATAVLAVGAVSAPAQQYPLKPVMIITNESGGGTDVMVRLLAPGLAANLGQQVVVQNRPGNVGPVDVAKAAPDGYTLLVAGSAVWTQLLIRDYPWDMVRDFAPIGIVSLQPHALLVHPSLPVKSVKELIALARARPGALNNATGSVGTPGHMSGELFKSMAGIDVVQVQYKGSAAGNVAVMSGEAQMTFASLGGALQLIKSGKVRVLGVSTAGPTLLLPGAPAIAETLPGYEISVTNSAWAPLKTPDAVIRKLAAEIQRVLAQPDMKKLFANSGNEIVTGSPEQLMAMMKAEVARLSKVAGPIRARLAAEESGK